MKKCYKLIIALFFTGLSARAPADVLRYDFVSAEYYQYSSEIDGVSVAPEGEGVSLELSFAVRPYIVLTAGYRRGRAHSSSSGAVVEADSDSTSAGILVHLPINTKADFILAVSFFNGGQNVDKDGAYFATVDEDGGVTTAGSRVMVSDRLELNGFVHKKSIEGSSRIGLSFGASYYVTESVSADVGYFIDNDSDSLAFGLTRYF